MSNTEQNSSWEPKIPTEPDNNFNDWLNWENKFGEYGQPGYERIILPIRAPKVFGTDSFVDLTWTLYRGEDGLLLGVHASYYDADEIRHPFVMTVHPDHRGKGIATQISLYLEEEFIANEAHKYGMTPAEFAAMPRAERAALVVPDIYKDVTTNSAGAGFLNNLVDKFYTVEKEFLIQE
jgi:GNAT superfamily N-acetyltransferase